MSALSSIITVGAATGFITLTAFAIGLVIERIAPAAPAEIEGIRLNVIYGIFQGFVRHAVSTMLAGISFFSIGAMGGGLITLPSEGWKVVITDKDGKSYPPEEFDKLLAA